MSSLRGFAGVVVLVALLLVVGCAAEADAAQDLCGDCGQVSASAECCAPDAEECSDCGKAKGSPGCCQ